VPPARLAQQGAAARPAVANHEGPDVVAAWFEAGFNVGIVCHERTGVAILDPAEFLE
jgi:hypothetical protein